MKFDLHTHHERCGHADASIRDYIESAIQQGFTAIGISDHSPYFGHVEDQPFPGIAMARTEFANYVAEVLELKKQYKDRIEVLLGVESDFFPEHAAKYQAVYENYPFDYVIGSVHQVRDVSIFNKKRFKGLSASEIRSHKDDYYDLIAQSAKSGMFQVLGHIDAMKAYFPRFSNIQTESIDKTLKIIGECGIAIEINTSGKTKECGGWYPADDILKRALYYGVDVTFGSDAHKPSRVGDEWEQVAERLHTIGFRHWVFYRQKQKQIVTL